MPSPRNKLKATGDTHLPDVESEFAVEQRREEKAEEERGQAAGVLKDKDARTGNSDGNTRDSGETSPRK
jgi:hypothetical protein